MRVHAWVDGRSPGPDELTEELAGQVGALLARIHALPMTYGGELPQDRRTPYGAARWQALVERAEAVNVALDWPAPLRTSRTRG